MLEKYKTIIEKINSMLSQSGTTSVSHTPQFVYEEIKKNEKELKEIASSIVSNSEDILPSEYKMVIDFLAKFTNWLAFENGEYQLPISLLETIAPTIKEKASQSYWSIVSTLGRLYIDKYEHFKVFTDLKQAEKWYLEYEEAVKKGENKEEQKWTVGNKHALARVNLMLGEYARHHRQESSAQPYFAKAKELLTQVILFRGTVPENESEKDKNDRLRRLGNSNVELGLLEMYLGHYQNAEALLYSAISIANTLPDNMQWVEKAWCLHRLGQIKNARGNFHEAADDYLKVIDILNENRKGNVHPRIGDVISSLLEIREKLDSTQLAKLNASIEEAMEKLNARSVAKTELTEFQIKMFTAASTPQKTHERTIQYC